MMTSDYPRVAYYTRLAKATRLTSADTTRLLRQAGSLGTSDYYSTELVKAFGTGAQDAGVRAAIVEMVERMTSDYYQAESIQTMLGDGAPGPAEMVVLVRLVPRMMSGYFMSQVLQKVLRSASLNSNHRAAIATAAGTISEDFYSAEVLQSLAKRGLGDDVVRRAFFDAASNVQSEHYHGQVLLAVLGGQPSERDLLDVVASSKQIGSEYYRADVLQRVARDRAATERVRTAVLDAIGGMSSHYAEQVRRAAGR
jgi:hypothetical protein